MGDKVALQLQERTVQGKALKALRKSGFIPAVMYGENFEARSVMAPALTMLKVYKTAGKHHPVELQLGSQKRLAMIKTADIDPVKHQLRHVAFHVVNQNETVATEIPIVISGEGETIAEKAGFVVLKTIETVEIEALPNNLPDALVAPGEKLAEVGDHLTVADLVVPKDVTVTSDATQVIATVYEPSALAAANDAAGGSAEEEVPAEEGDADAEAEATEEGK